MSDYQPGSGRTGPIEYDDGKSQIRIGGRVGGRFVANGQELDPEQFRTGAARPGPIQPGPTQPGPAQWSQRGGPASPTGRPGPAAGPAGGQARQAVHTGDLVVGPNVVRGTEYPDAPYGWNPNNPNLDVDRPGPPTFGGDVTVRASDGPAGRSFEVHAPEVTGDLVVGSGNVVGSAGRAQPDPRSAVDSSRSYADRTRNGGQSGPGTELRRG